MKQTSLKTYYETDTCSMLHDVERGIQHSPFCQGRMKTGTGMKGERTKSYCGTNMVHAVNYWCFGNMRRKWKFLGRVEKASKYVTLEQKAEG